MLEVGLLEEEDTSFSAYVLELQHLAALVSGVGCVDDSYCECGSQVDGGGVCGTVH